MLLPPAEGETPPRVSLIHTAYSVRALVQDITGVCERNPEACAASGAALALLAGKMETGAAIVSAGIALGDPLSQDKQGHGTLTDEDLQPDWELATAH